ncbi:MAG: tetratricopeptide repeat protein [Calditrichaceae bacterium]
MKAYSVKYLFILLLAVLTGCAYYNTFFNAKQNYKTAQIKQQKIKSGQELPADIKNHYLKTIDKCWKLINSYGDSSKYADDALLLIGKSHFMLTEYDQAEHIFKQFLLKYINSPFTPEARLWMAKTYIHNRNDNEALNTLNELLKSKVSKKIAAEALYNLGELYFKEENYKLAIENLEKCIIITSDNEIAGYAQLLIADSFYKSGEFDNAIFNYDKIKKYDVPPLKEYEAMIQKVNALNELEKFQESELTLKGMLRDQRFKEQYSQIETRLANTYEYEGNLNFAKEAYEDVLKKYPRSEGAAMASFYLGQLYEFEYGNYDSAKVKYDGVRLQFSSSEAQKDASARSTLLAEYLKIRDQLTKDRSDLYSLTVGDSVLIDSVETGSDTINVKVAIKDTTKQIQEFETQQKVVTKKVAVSRTPEEVEKSNLRNSFALGEFFLLKYQRADSAEAAYRRFVKNFEDSLLTPKAHYALYYIYNDLEKDTVKADSAKYFILSHYRDSVYGKKLAGATDKIVQPGEAGKNKEVKALYAQAEELVSKKQYAEALKFLDRIVKDDHLEEWTEKSIYAMAFIYENYLKNIPMAIEQYSLIANVYPDSKYAKIAKLKIKEPVIEKTVPELDPSEREKSIINAETDDIPKENIPEGSVNESIAKDKNLIKNRLLRKTEPEKSIEKPVPGAKDSSDINLNPIR